MQTGACSRCGMPIRWMRVQDFEHAKQWGLMTGAKGEMNHVNWWLPLESDGNAHSGKRCNTELKRQEEEREKRRSDSL